VYSRENKKDNLFFFFSKTDEINLNGKINFLGRSTHENEQSQKLQVTTQNENRPPKLIVKMFGFILLYQKSLSPYSLLILLQETHSDVLTQHTAAVLRRKT
jgi:hypothetical protein